MKIEDERVCVTVSTVRRQQQDEISAENSCCMKLVTWRPVLSPAQGAWECCSQHCRHCYQGTPEKSKHRDQRAGANETWGKTKSSESV